MTYRTLPMPTPLAQAARRTGRAPGYGHPVHASAAPADGYGPCRHCLRRFKEGERRLLMTYNPYPEPPEVPVVGPVFIHEAACAAFEGEGLPDELRGLPMVAQGHLREGRGLLNLHLDPEDPEAGIQALLQDPRVDSITLRNAEAGCFMARLVRE